VTMIVSVLTPSHALQVSDRRVSLRNRDGAIAWKDDKWNKAIVFLNRVTFGYTGAAIASESFRNERIDQWICKVLQPCWTITEAFDSLASSASQLLAPRSLRQELAMFGAGWSEDSAGTFTPFLGVVSNYLTELGRHSGTVSRDFHLSGYRLGDSNVFLYVGGQEMERERKYRLLRQLEKVVARQLDPWQAIRLIGTAIRESGAEAGDRSTISQDLMAVTVPKPTRGRERELFLMSGPPQPDVITSCFIPAGKNDLEFFMANLCGGGASMTNASGIRGQPK
jgi:hypothetical protein